MGRGRKAAVSAPHLTSSRGAAWPSAAETKPERRGRAKHRAPVGLGEGLDCHLPAVGSHWRVVSGLGHDPVYHSKQKRSVENRF